MKYTGTATSKLLLEAGFGTYISQWGYTERPGNPTAALVRVQEQTTQFFDANGNRVAGATPNGLTVAGDLKYRSSNWPTGYIFANTWNASASYVTGAHNMKFGYQGAFHRDDDNLFDIITNDQRMTYRFGAGVNAAGQAMGYGVPNQVTIQAGPWTRKVRTGYAAFFAQDQWTMGRMTLQGALRFDRAYSRFPEQTIPQDVWWPTEFVIPEAKGVNAYLDLSPRVGFAYDVFGNGKTSFKANVGRYLHPASNAGRFDAANPAARVVTLANRPVDRRQRQLPCRLRPAERDRSGQPRRRRRSVRSGRSELRPQPRDDHSRPVGSAGVEGATLRLAVRRVGAAGTSARACRPKSATTAGGGRSTTART